LSQNLEEQWRVGKRLVKLQAIDHSKLYHSLAQDRAKSFIKREVLAKMPTKARLIQGNYNEATAYEHPDEYAAISSALKEPLQLNLGGVSFTLQYAGGLTHDELSDLFTDWWAQAGPGAVLDERDGKNWDATMQRPLLLAEIAFYEALGLLSASSALLRSRGVRGSIRLPRCSPQVIRYFTAWKRLSGDWDTSVGNTLISMLIAMVTISELPNHLRPTHARCFFMGDDFLGVYSFRQSVSHVDLAQALDDGESSMGITPERGLFSDPLFVSFISLGLWPRRDGSWQFVPHPAKQLVKLFASSNPVPLTSLEDYQTALAIAFWPVYWGFPLMMKFLQRHYVKPTTRMTCSGYFVKLLTQRVRDIDWCTGFVGKYRIPFVATHFHIPEGLVQRHPVVDLMLKFELSPPQERLQ
jgi:hypothetical protein